MSSPRKPVPHMPMVIVDTALTILLLGTSVPNSYLDLANRHVLMDIILLAAGLAVAITMTVRFIRDGQRQPVIYFAAACLECVAILSYLVDVPGWWLAGVLSAFSAAGAILAFGAWHAAWKATGHTWWVTATAT